MNRTKELSYLVAGTGVFSTNVLVLDLLFMTYYSWGKYPLQVYLGKASLLAEPPPQVLAAAIPAAGGTGGLVSQL